MIRDRLLVIALGALALAACSRAKDASNAAASAATEQPAAPAAASSDDADDPCRYVTQAEAERWVGPLVHPPFRATDPGAPDTNGGNCKYVGAGGRYVMVEMTLTNGSAGFAAIKMGSSLAGKVFTEETGKTDTLEGAWDDARWMGAGMSFFAIKGEALVSVHVGAVKDMIPAGADLASKALARASSPLAYDGAKAVAGAPVPRETGDACALLTAADFPAAGLTLDGTPTPSGRGDFTTCKYHVKGKSGPADVEIDVNWNGGFQHFAEGKMTIGAVMGQTAGMPHTEGQAGEPPKKTTANKPMDTNDADAQNMKKMMGALQAMGAGQGIHMNAQGGLQHDTMIAGPWDEGAFLGGTSFVAVKNDISVTMGFTTMTLDQAKALMAKVMAKL